MLTSLLALAFALVPDPTRLFADLDGDGVREVIEAFVGVDGDKVFLQRGERGAIDARTSPVYPAWKALAGRLEGEIVDLVVLGAWTTKRVRRGEPPRRTIWVVGYDRGRWFARWRGSALARPFDDYTLRDLDGDGDVELCVRECGGPRPGLTAYRWNGFGFTGIARVAAPCDAPWERLEGER